MADTVANRSPSGTPADLNVVPSAEDDALGALARRRVLDGVAFLPVRRRASVVMRHWMRMTEAEIAETLELSVGSVRTHRITSSTGEAVNEFPFTRRSAG